MSSPAALLSIVIPAFNEDQLLPRTIARIREACDSCATLTRRYEIIVCDNNSTDQTSPIATRLGCRVVFEPVNQISRARNRGAAAAVGEWLLFIDADSWPCDGLMNDAAGLFGHPIAWDAAARSGSSTARGGSGGHGRARI